MKTIHVVAAIIHDGDHVFATQRGYGDYKDWWEFPGGKVESGEIPEEALVREIREELAAGIAVERYLTTVEYDYPDFHLSMDCFWCSLAEGNLTLLVHEAARWLPLDNLRQVNWLPADILVVETMEKERFMLKEKMFFARLSAEYDADVAKLIRTNLKARGLDIPGTAYFDEALDHLSVFYECPGRAYYVLLENEQVVGGIGLAEFDGFDACCELQKLYLDDKVKGNGLGYVLIDYIEERAREMGYRQIYLETHDNLQTAIHVYEKSGYREIPRPAGVVHSTMNRFFLKNLLENLTI